MNYYLIYAAWYSLGLLGFIYWWTTEHRLTKKEIPVMLLVGNFGAFAFLVGYLIHGGRK
jgi:hypothetical protein